MLSGPCRKGRWTGGPIALLIVPKRAWGKSWRIILFVVPRNFTSMRTPEHPHATVVQRSALKGNPDTNNLHIELSIEIRMILMPRLLATVALCTATSEVVEKRRFEQHKLLHCLKIMGAVAIALPSCTNPRHMVHGLWPQSNLS
eukprot:SAG11_NODE_4606_length_1838_cov_1.256469_3_plen_144_part_00